MESFYTLCYIPHHRLIAVSCHALGLVKALSCDMDNTVWELAGQVQGLQIGPGDGFLPSSLCFVGG